MKSLASGHMQVQPRYTFYFLCMENFSDDCNEYNSPIPGDSLVTLSHKKFFMIQPLSDYLWEKKASKIRFKLENLEGENKILLKQVGELFTHYSNFTDEKTEA